MKALALLLATTLFGGQVDLFGQPVVPQIRGRPLLVFFSNSKMRESTIRTGTELSLRLHEVPYVTIVRVDLRGSAGVLRFLARREMKDAYRESVERTRQLYRRAGLPPPASSGHHLIFVPDWEGEGASAAGLAKGFTESIGIVYAPDGREVVRAPFPVGVPRLERALRAFAKRERKR